MMQNFTSYSDEAQLLGYGESDSYGPWIKLRLNDHEALENFRSQPKGAKLGKRYALVLAEIGDDEQPVPPPKVVAEVETLEVKKELCGASKAALLTKQPNFIEFAKSMGWDDSNLFLKSECKITSKRELNDPMWGTERRYNKLIGEFRAYVNGR